MYSSYVLIATASVLPEGTTPSYVPMSYPAVADFELVGAMLAAARAANRPAHAGIVRSHDALYADLHAGRMPRREELEDAPKVWQRARVLCNDMETSTIVVICALVNLRRGSVLTVVTEPGEAAIDPARVAPLDPAPMFRVALAGARQLAPLKA